MMDKTHEIPNGDAVRFSGCAEAWMMPEPSRLVVDLWDPSNDGNTDVVEVGLCDVRGADSIRISYDFDRDGYSITQSDWDDEGESWAEVAFVKSWGRSR